MCENHWSPIPIAMGLLDTSLFSHSNTSGGNNRNQ